MKNARFWIFENGGKVKITLKPDQEISWHIGGACDEGYHHEYITFKFIDGIVYCETETSDLDCDGRFDTSRYVQCPIGFIVNQTPIWSEIKSYQHDYSAEAMGY